MRRRHKYNKIRENKIKKIRRATIFFIFITILIICVGPLITVKLSVSRQKVQAMDISQNTDLNANNKIDMLNNSAISENKSEVEDVAFVEKYLDQQMKGQKPHEADGKRVAYLTFDDGPSETVTPLILDILKSENVHATFFVVGKEIDKNETTKNIVKREFSEGNAIGNHTYSHNYNYLYPNRKINVTNCMSDIEKTNRSLKNVLGEDFSTRVIRLPGGNMTWESKNSTDMGAMYKAIHGKGYHQIDWNSLSKDAEGLTKNAEQLKEEVIKTVYGRQKAIILMHDTYGKEETVKALPEIIKYLKEQGYEFKIIK
jgi:peptidoglycan/xylan/chitin deacetylase (PgdA/CDA1 family)